MGQVIDLHEWRRRHTAASEKAKELPLVQRRPQAFWAEPMLLSSLTVWRDAAVMWAGILLAASSEAGFLQAGHRAPAPARAEAAALSPLGSRS